MKIDEVTTLYEDANIPISLRRPARGGDVRRIGSFFDQLTQAQVALITIQGLAKLEQPKAGFMDTV